MGRLMIGILAATATGALFLTDGAARAVRGADGVSWLTFGVDPFLAGHFVVWFTLAGGAAVVVAPYPRLLVPVSGVLFAMSVAVEEGQQRLTTIRGFELRDVVANGSGVVVGALAAAFVLGVRDRSRTPRPPALPTLPTR